VEEHALFAARKEFELLKLLATNKKALATARRLGAFHPQPQPPSPAAAAGAGKATAAPQSALLQRRSKRCLTLARGVVHCAAQASRNSTSRILESLIAGHHVHCQTNSAESSTAHLVFLAGLPMRVHLLAL
jgi:hypothetical protein